MRADERFSAQRGGPSSSYMQRRRLLLADNNGDPMEAMGNIFDVAMLIGVGFLIMALSGIGLRDFLSQDKVTIVKNPGAKNMEIITKTGTTIERLKVTDRQSEGAGTAIGTVYKLQNGDVVWVPGTTTAP